MNISLFKHPLKYLFGYYAFYGKVQLNNVIKLIIVAMNKAEPDINSEHATRTFNTLFTLVFGESSQIYHQLIPCQLLPL